VAGPLSGVKVVELGGIGPVPFAAMMLADMGADVVRIHRTQTVAAGVDPMAMPVLDRNRRSIGVDLKSSAGVETVLRLVERADALLEGFRPGVAERLGAGPDACLARNPRLVYAQMTGWGQEGPLAQGAGHDINYLARAGVLAHLGRAGEKPTPPLNMLADFGGGGMLLAFGVLCGVIEARVSGHGQVLDAAMIDGSALLMAMTWGMRAQGRWNEAERGTNLVDTGAPFYDTYECADGRYISVAPIEPPFYAELLRLTGLAEENLPDPDDPANWPALRARFTALFKSRTRDEWCGLLDNTDACFAPVLTMTEAASDPQVRARSTIVELRGALQPAPAPRFSRTQLDVPAAEPRPGEHTVEVLRDWGFTPEDVEGLLAEGAVQQGAVQQEERR
jgi:alpha-methylacyl-CoA racemase